MRPLILAVAGAALLYAGVAAAQEAPTSKNKAGRDVGDAAAGPVGKTSAATLGSVNTSAFVQNAARSDMYEIQAADLAQQKSQNSQIKDFAQMMAKDHMMTTQKLMAALPAGVAAPKDLDKRRQGMLDNLKNSSAGEFDKRYVTQQVNAHEEALTLLQGYSKRGDNAQLKQLAAQTAPMVQMHLTLAKALPGAPKK
jgi:putative membrane protein